MTPSSFVERLKQGPLLFDGAIGTLLHSQGADLDRCFDELNLTHPVEVAEVLVGFGQVSHDEERFVATCDIGVYTPKGLRDAFHLTENLSGRSTRSVRELDEPTDEVLLGETIRQQRIELS